jgi:hypothetical protein
VAYEIKCDGHERGLKKIAQFRLTRFADPFCRPVLPDPFCPTRFAQNRREPMGKMATQTRMSTTITHTAARSLTFMIGSAQQVAAPQRT